MKTLHVLLLLQIMKIYVIIYATYVLFNFTCKSKNASNIFIEYKASVFCNCNCNCKLNIIVRIILNILL